MSIICLIIGALLGAFIDNGSGVALGAFLGFMVGLALDRSKTSNGGTIKAQLVKIEEKFDWLYDRHQETQEELARLKQGWQKNGGASVFTPSDPTSAEGSPSTTTPDTSDIITSPAINPSEAAPRLESQTPLAHLAPIPTVAVALEKTTATATTTHSASAIRKAERMENSTHRTHVNSEPDAENADDTPSFWQRLISGNLVAKMGVIILFFGVGFLLKYAYDHAVFPPEYRLIGVSIVAVAMLVFGWRMQATRRLYGLILQGGGVGLLYLVVFFALKTFALIGSTPAFALFMALGVATVLMAVRQDARVLAVLGLVGAFLAPPLASSGSGNYIVLFSYYTLLNAFILTISWFKSWRELNLTGFIFTFIIAAIWGASNYQPANFATVEPFLLVFFAMYLVIPILFAQRQPPELTGFVDGTLVFGTPLATAFMQAALVRGMGDNALAWSAGVGAFLYAVLATMTVRRPNTRLLGETYIALATVLGTLTIFFALDAYPTFALWTLEGAAIVWIGIRQKRPLARAFGLLLQIVGALYFLSKYDSYALLNPYFNDFTLGCAIISVASLITAYLMQKYSVVLKAGELGAGHLMMLWGLLWWFVGGLHVIDHALVHHSDFPMAALGFVAASIVLYELCGCVLNWASLRRVQWLLPAVMLIVAVAQSADNTHPLAQYGSLSWPFAFIVLYTTLKRHERDEIAIWSGIQHIGALWLLTLLVTWEAHWQITHFMQLGHSTLSDQLVGTVQPQLGSTWISAAWGLPTAIILFMVSRLSNANYRPIVWPFTAHGKLYVTGALSPLALFGGLWFLLATLSNTGDSAPWSYLPILNPLDITLIAMLFALWGWRRALSAHSDADTLSTRPSQFSALIGFLCFVGINGVVLRSIHQWAQIPFESSALFNSVLVQAAFSILWSATALALMLYATHTARRGIWITGAGLLAVVVGKLFLVDLGNSGTVARIVSFIGVGVLLMVIGYVAPVPPGGKEKEG